MVRKYRASTRSNMDSRYWVTPSSTPYDKESLSVVKEVFMAEGGFEPSV